MPFPPLAFLPPDADPERLLVHAYNHGCDTRRHQTPALLAATWGPLDYAYWAGFYGSPIPPLEA